MSSNPTFRTESGMFGLCGGIWNKETGTFRNANVSDQIACCLTSCQPEITYCLDQCMESHGPESETPDPKLYIECRNNCARILLACKNTCSVIDPSSGAESAIISCMEKEKCGTFPSFDKDCIERNEKEIKDCCESKCTDSSNINCEEYCNTKYLNYVGKSESPLVSMFNKDPRFRSNPFKDTNTKEKPVLSIFLIISIVITVCFIIFMTLKN